MRADAAVAREDSEFAVLGRQVAIGGQVLELQGLGGVYSDVFLPLHGEHQAHNAAVALAAVEAFFGAGADRQLDVDAVRAGFAAATSPGRLERMRSAPTVFIDAAHNPAGAAALAADAGRRVRLPLPGRRAQRAGRQGRRRHPRRAGTGVRPGRRHPQRLAAGAGGRRAGAGRAEERFGPDRVVTAENLPDAIEDRDRDGRGGAAARRAAFSGAGIVITGSVVTAGAARTLFGSDPE